MGEENMMNTSWEKLKELLSVIVGQFIGWFDEAFPPETRREQLNQWILFGSPFIVFGLVLLLLLFCCCGRRPGKMMKAPGRRNHQIQRGDFQSDPRSYFRNLRAKGKRN